MKIKTARLQYEKGVGIELVSETEVEYAVLQDLWANGELNMGDGDSVAPCGGQSGFYISYPRKESKP